MKPPDFWLSELEYDYSLNDIRKCWIKGSVRPMRGSPWVVTTIDPPLNYEGRSRHELLIQTHYVGDSLAPVHKWPTTVRVAVGRDRIEERWFVRRKHIDFIALGEIYPSEEAAKNRPSAQPETGPVRCLTTSGFTILHPLIFLGEKRGHKEDEFKRRVKPLLDKSRYSGIASLARVAVGNERKEFPALCIWTIGPPENAGINELNDVFLDPYCAETELLLLLIDQRRYADLERVCHPFFARSFKTTTHWSAEHGQLILPPSAHDSSPQDSNL